MILKRMMAIKMRNKVIDPGKYNQRITIYKIESGRNSRGFPTNKEHQIIKCDANVKTTRGWTLIINNSDFEKAYTKFTIRYYPKVVEAYNGDDKSNRKLQIEYKNQRYSVEYLDNVDEANVEIELQAKKVRK